ncbi:hypothetical protein ADN00_08860 [Ornatilinea apprima]|uniref:Uncharacterized protein n=1 Tax=Ornatilinea apprima TaxID=1134406 RepID=A0A0P6XBU0_9CHLR|nr:hypothetical protein [Ornatilinea apprima]KPL77246.1 hypothetical protein ADN00_08860 [Ornatilinea apprima]
MDIVNIGSVQFKDRMSGELSYIVVRVVDNSIGIGISEESSGDAEVFFDTEKCELIIEWLSTALATARTISAR